MLQMKFHNRQMHLQIVVILLVLKAHEIMASSSCNPAILRLYGWCEQWTCSEGCSCTARQDCRQYCDVGSCKDMRCTSPSICKQKVHINGQTEPHVFNMFARAPFVTQDCSGGRCDVMRARGPWRKSRGKKADQSKTTKQRVKERETKTKTKGQDTPSAALQNCVAGVCQRVISTLEISKQFCTYCTKMHCLGEHAKNCTQVCAVGNCRQVQCDSKDCQQACLQNATCTMKCGKNVETCLQICEEGSKCNMFCDAKNCRQICGGNKDCERFMNGKRIQLNTPINQNFSGNSSTTAWTEISDQNNKTVINNSTSEPRTQIFTTPKSITLSNSILLGNSRTQQNTVEGTNDAVNVKAMKDRNTSPKLTSNIFILILLLAGNFIGELVNL